MINISENYTNVKKLIRLLAENQKFAKPKDNLTKLIQQHSSYLSEELSDDELYLATAAKMPAVPKYKLIKDNL